MTRTLKKISKIITTDSQPFKTLLGIVRQCPLQRPKMKNKIHNRFSNLRLFGTLFSFLDLKNEKMSIHFLTNSQTLKLFCVTILNFWFKDQKWNKKIQNQFSNLGNFWYYKTQFLDKGQKTRIRDSAPVPKLWTPF